MGKRDVEKWRSIFKDYKSSHLGVVQYCALNNIAPSTFHHCKRTMIDRGELDGIFTKNDPVYTKRTVNECTEQPLIPYKKLNKELVLHLAPIQRDSGLSARMWCYMNHYRLTQYEQYVRALEWEGKLPFLRGRSYEDRMRKAN